MVAVLNAETCELATERIEAEVCTLAGQIAAATCRFVLLIAELDRREAWKEWGCGSMAHWLSWKCALGMVAAREHVRVGRALEALPLLRGLFADGRLSYSKVRALTRVATPEHEGALLDFAQDATAAQLDRTVRAFERSRTDAATEQARLDRLRVLMCDESDGTVDVRARVTREQADLLSQALTEARKQTPVDDDAPAEARDVCALELILRSFLAGNSDRNPTETVVHVDAEDLEAEAMAPAVARLLCDTSVRVVPGPAKRTRTIPRRLRRLIARRDQGACRFPGCPSTRFLHVHHLIHFAHGGATDADNCITLCWFHHRLVHEGGWTARGSGEATVEFVSPTGRCCTDAVAPLPVSLPLRSDPAIDEHTIATALGEPMRLVDGVDAFYDWLKVSRN